MLNSRQAIIWTNADPIYWHIYAALGGDELRQWHNNDNWIEFLNIELSRLGDPLSELMLGYCQLKFWNKLQWNLNKIQWVSFKEMKISHAKWWLCFLDLQVLTRCVESTSTSEVTLSSTSTHPTLVTTSWSWMIYSYPYCPMSISPPISEIWLFQNLTFNTQGQGQKCKSVVNVWGDTVGQASIWFPSFLFHINQTTHSWDAIIPKFDLGNPTSRSWVRSQAKVT